ncbi:MAG: alpha/beta hydrolase [Vicinamibacterales bacterium]
MMKPSAFLLTIATALVPALAAAQGRPQAPTVPTPTDVKPTSITCEECPYPYPTSYLPLTLYGQDVRIAYMDVAPQGTPNGHTVVLLHGNNFAGFYFGVIIDALRKEGFRVVVPDQIGYGRSSKPIIPYNFTDMARNTRAILQSLNIDKAMIVGHSMGGMLAARFATQFPGVTERLVIFNPIGLTDARFDPAAVWRRRRGLQADAGVHLPDDSREPDALRGAQPRRVEQHLRVVHAHPVRMDPGCGLAAPGHGADPDFQRAVSGSGGLRLGAHQGADLRAAAPTSFLAGTPAAFQERMKFLASTIPNGNAKLELLPGLGHVPFLEDPGRSVPPLVAYLKEGVK